jgi:hypothetical protein
MRDANTLLSNQMGCSQVPNRRKGKLHTIYLFWLFSVAAAKGTMIITTAAHMLITDWFFSAWPFDHVGWEHGQHADIYVWLCVGRHVRMET